MGARQRNKKQWHELASLMRDGYRPTTLARVWDVVGTGVSGFHTGEAAALWHACKTDGNIRSIAEVGRCLGGTLWMMACCNRKLEEVYSIDVQRFDVTDDAFHDFFTIHGIKHKILVDDSRNAKPERKYDLVIIDGEHTGEGVTADIKIWWQHARLLCFHDYADKGRNYHRRRYSYVVAAISYHAEKYGWKQVGERGKSEIIFEVMP